MLTLRGSTRTSSSRTYVGVGNYCLDRKMLFTLVARALAPPGPMHVEPGFLHQVQYLVEDDETVQGVVESGS